MSRDTTVDEYAIVGSCKLLTTPLTYLQTSAKWLTKTFQSKLPIMGYSSIVVSLLIKGTCYYKFCIAAMSRCRISIIARSHTVFITLY